MSSSQYFKTNTTIQTKKMKGLVQTQAIETCMPACIEETNCCIFALFCLCSCVSEMTEKYNETPS
eukprot:m.32704 g.32704  ORF g.32704 m.32704 type:complete len:65 (+) comp10814_c0_seq2:1230-1424(+)